jgi:hypothetical protein
VFPKNVGFLVSAAKSAREGPGIPGLFRETRTLRNYRDCVAGLRGFELAYNGIGPSS